MANYDYDVLYIGSGHGTFDGAIPLGAKGKRLALLNKIWSAVPAQIAVATRKLS